VVYSDQLARLLALSRGFMEARIFLTAVQLGIFPAIGEGSPTADELAARIGADRRALVVLLNALVAQRLLAKEGERFANIAEVAKLLEPPGPDRSTGFEHAVDMWDAWSRLSNVVTTGTPVRPPQRQDASRESAAAMDLYSKMQAGPLIRILDCSGVGCLLDLGGGTGTYTLEMAKRHPQLRAVIFDANEAALRIARERAARDDLLDRVCLRRGDFRRDDIGNGYDMVLMASVICLLGEQENLALIGRVYEALNRGGQLVISDAMVNASGTNPSAAAVFGVHMLVTTGQGQAYPYEQVSRWLRSAGFSGIQRIPLGDGCVIMARR
jgi:precorrin-6B methylase 2